MELRYKLSLAALVVVILLGLQIASRAEPSSSVPGEYQPFPATVTARAPALPQVADGAWSRIQQHVLSLNTMWREAFRAAGHEYEEPHVVQQAISGCGAVQAGWAGLYCPEERTLVIDIEAHVKRHVGIGQGVSDQLLGYVIAHELGHHVQTLRGAPMDQRLKRELHAECLAGVWAKAAGIALLPPWAYVEDAEHGTVQQQIQWLNRGYSAAQPADCDAIWSGAAL